MSSTHRSSSKHSPSKFGSSIERLTVSAPLPALMSAFSSLASDIKRLTAFVIERHTSLLFSSILARELHLHSSSSRASATTSRSSRFFNHVNEVAFPPSSLRTFHRVSPFLRSQLSSSSLDFRLHFFYCHHQGCHQGCGKRISVYLVLCIIILQALVAFFVVDIIFFLMYTQLDNNYLLDTASFLCLNFQTFLIIIYTVITRLELCFRRGNPAFNALPYDMDTCVRRVTLVQAFYNTSGKCYLKSCSLLMMEILIFFLFPLLNTILQIAFGFSVFFTGCESNWQMATLVIKPVLYLYYGCFWYVVYVQRVYLNCQLNNALDTIRKLAGQTDCDGARRLIDSIYSEFHVVRYFTGRMMAFTLLTVTFHTFCCAILTYCKLPMATSGDLSMLTMRWIENIMFFVVPIYAIGGIDLESLWTKFRRVLVKCKVQDQILFWNEVLSYATQIDTLASFPLVWTGLFPIIVGTILAGIIARRDSISLEYWNYLSNCTNSMESNFKCLN